MDWISVATLYTFGSSELTITEVNSMDRKKLIDMGWTFLQGEDLAAANTLLKFDLDKDFSFAKKFGRKTVFFRYTDSFRFYIPFDRDDPARLDSRYGYKLSAKRWLPPGYEKNVDEIAWELVKKFDELMDSI